MSDIESTLSDYNIMLAEAAILSDKLIPENSPIPPSISHQYYDDVKEGWEWINRDDVPVTSYKLVASNANGLATYGFYKAKSGKIYIINAYLNNIIYVFVPSKNMDCLKNIL